MIDWRSRGPSEGYVFESTFISWLIIAVEVGSGANL